MLAYKYLLDLGFARYVGALTGHQQERRNRVHILNTVIRLVMKIGITYILRKSQKLAISENMILYFYLSNKRYTVNPNPVQLTGKPCKSIPTGKYLLSLQGNPVLIAGSLFWLQGFPCISLYFPVRDCSVGFVLSFNCPDHIPVLQIMKKTIWFR